MYTTLHIYTEYISCLTVKLPTKVALFTKIMYNGNSTMNVAVMLNGIVGNENALFRILDHCYANKPNAE